MDRLARYRGLTEITPGIIEEAKGFWEIKGRFHQPWTGQRLERGLMPMGFHSFGPVEMGIVAFIIMLIFGVGRLPEVGGAMGKAIRGFRHGVAGDDEDEAEEKPALSKPARRSRRVAPDSPTDRRPRHRT